MSRVPNVAPLLPGAIAVVPSSRPGPTALGLGLAAIALWAGGLAGCNDLGVGFDAEKSAKQQAAAAAAAVVPVPEVELTAPARASFLAVGPVAVEGTTRSAPGSGAPITFVRVNGQTVSLEPDGTFRTFVDLTPGLNVIDCSVVDAAGVSGGASVGVLAGDWLPMGQPVRNAASLRINNAAMGGLARVAEEGLWALDIAHLLRDPIVDETILGFIQAQVLLFNPRFHNVFATLRSDVDGLHVEAEIIRPFIEVEARLSLLSNPEFASAIADTGFIRGRLTLFLQPDGKLGARIEDAAVDFVNFQASFDPRSFLATIAPLLQGLIQSQLEKLLEKELTDLNPKIEQALSDFTGGGQSFDILGKPFAIDIRGESVQFDPQGFGVGVRFDAPPQAPLTARAQRAPGSYRTFGAAPALSSQSGVVAVVDDDLLNRMFHVAWASGLLQQDLTQQLLQQQSITLPSGGITAGDLAQLLPEIGVVAQASAPLGVRIDCGLPPVFKVTGAPDLVVIELGEAYVDILVDRGNGMELLFKAAVHIEVGATATFDNTTGIKLSSARNATLSVDLLDMPLVRVDERRVQVMLSTVLTPLIPRLINKVTVVPVPFVTQLSAFNLQASQAGPANDHLMVTVDLSR